MASLALAFDILARDKGASSTLEKIGGSAEKTGGKLSKLGGVAKGAGIALGGLAVGGVAALGAALVQGGKDAVSFETLARKTEAVLKSTGNTAGTSVKGIQKLAGSLESLSGVDEELIINSQNVLATFTKIRNTKTDKIFDQATKSALNMSVALGQDLQSATTMLGKALNDPIAGISAMSRAGVQFTQDQKDQIRVMVEAGDVMGAQKVILGELETQFGGVAEAAGSGMAGSMARLQDAFSDAFRELATALLPTLTDLAEWLAAHLPAAIETARNGLKGVVDWVQANWPTIQGVISAVANVLINDVWPVVRNFGFYIVTAFSSLVGWVDENWPKVQAVIEAVAAFLEDTVWPMIDTFTTDVVAAFERVKVWHDENMPDIKQAWMDFAVFLLGDVWPKINDFVEFTILAFVSLGRGVAMVWRSIKDEVGFVVGYIVNGAGVLFRNWIGQMETGFRALGDMAKHAWEWIKKVISVLDTVFEKMGKVSGTGGNVGGFLQTLGTVVPGGGVVDDFIGLFSGRAMGGPVTAGVPYIVGEHRPELFVPTQNGYIHPRVPEMAGGSTYNVTIVAPPGTVRGERDLVRELRSAKYLLGDV